ncbi:hypothetical protein GOV09_02985 [Candidatus Woesearchaeota archaeon]|nr:hypothetical protein [Candidatus Woesearchaeota archaeon]
MESLLPTTRLTVLDPTGSSEIGPQLVERLRKSPAWVLDYASGNGGVGEVVRAGATYGNLRDGQITMKLREGMVTGDNVGTLTEIEFDQFGEEGEGTPQPVIDVTRDLGFAPDY